MFDKLYKNSKVVYISGTICLTEMGFGSNRSTVKTLPHGLSINTKYVQCMYHTASHVYSCVPNTSSNAQKSALKDYFLTQVHFSYDCTLKGAFQAVFVQFVPQGAQI